jgi:hypothetical protein
MKMMAERLKHGGYADEVMAMLAQETTGQIPRA